MHTLQIGRFIMRMKRTTAYLSALIFMFATLMGWFSFLYYIGFFKAI